MNENARCRPGQGTVLCLRKCCKSQPQWVQGDSFLSPWLHRPDDEVRGKEQYRNALRTTNGNIAYTHDGLGINNYQYDSANQLIRENNIAAGTTTIWTYDNAGNILTREVYPRCSGTPDPSTRISVVNYTYGDDKGWGDLLTAYNGVQITHDTIGNPLNDGTWTYTWQHGRQLTSMAKIDQSESWQFTYNADGMRTQRKKTVIDPDTGNTVTDLTYNYTYLGGQLTHMTVDGHTMYFAYDAAGTPMALTYNGVNYYYVTNIQGDVVSILNASGTEVVRYIYDAWGNLISTTGDMADTLGFSNPLRYRGYVYDAETGLYYLQSRYYNPEMGRFVNADGFASTGQGLLGNNMFAYCGNNPVCNKDFTGTRYIDALSVASETSKQRKYACDYQKEVVKENIFRRTYAEELAVLEGKSDTYKGVDVERIDNNYGSFSFGKIYLNSAEEADLDGIRTLRHEYGHTIQKEKLGTVGYTAFVAVPSITCASLFHLGKLNVHYYSLPWEFQAELYGNVPLRGGYENEVLIWYYTYQLMVRVITE